jgi:uncharacterized phosphosugar-binding protein
MEHIATYFTQLAQVMQQVATQSASAIQAAAEKAATAIMQEKQVLLFGSGHSALVARDAVGRAGGLVPLLQIEDVIDGDAERLPGMAKVILGRYALQAGDVIIIISNSGINAVPVEMALIAKEKHLTVIAITSLNHSQAVEPRHSSGKRLFEVADLVIDTHVPRGDTLVEVAAGLRSGAASTLVGSAIIQALTVQTAVLLAEHGITPPILISANMPGGDAHNRAVIQKYLAQLVRYQMSQYAP